MIYLLFIRTPSWFLSLSFIREESAVDCHLADLQSASISVAGVSVHEYLDAWWNFGLEDSLSQDPDDIEEWFGMVRPVPDGAGYSTEPRPVYDAVRDLWGP